MERKRSLYYFRLDPNQSYEWPCNKFPYKKEWYMDSYGCLRPQNRLLTYLQWSMSAPIVTWIILQKPKNDNKKQNTQHLEWLNFSNTRLENGVKGLAVKIFDCSLVLNVKAISIIQRTGSKTWCSNLTTEYEARAFTTKQGLFTAKSMRHWNGIDMRRMKIGNNISAARRPALIASFVMWQHL